MSRDVARGRKQGIMSVFVVADLALVRP